ncbi:hypothetical protein EMCRGX_G016037 [Ephydatia muelleri]
MTVTGKELDKEKTKLEIDTYFSKVNDIIRKGKLSKRVQFLLQDVVDLRDNQWVPRQWQDTEVKTIAKHPCRRNAVLQLELTEEQETREFFRKFQSILNRLTPQKLTKLVDATLQLKINTEERLRGVVDLIFTRVTTETTNCEVYTNLCRVLASLAVETVNAEGKPQAVTFIRLLVTKCQQVFEKDMQEDEERKTMQKGVETAETEEIRKQRQIELEAAEMASRHRSLGNIRFIGELYNLKILFESTIHECMIRLLKSSPNEKSLECFAKLMTVTGTELDKEKTKLEMDTYFSTVKDIIKKGTISKRVQFVLQDVVDLRDNKWVPRQRQDTKLRKAEQPWQRQAVLQLDLTEERKKTQDVFCKFRSILNRLTPLKLTKLVDATLQLKINTEERLRGVVDMIFTRAITETMYNEVYANFCCVLLPFGIETVNAERKPKTITFKRLLVIKCQQEFEKGMQEDEERETMQKRVETAETEEIRKQRQMELEAAEMASRHRSLGTIRFIGELYNLKILFESTIHECMIRLLKSSPNEKSLECFAKLMTVTGTELDKHEAKLEMDTYFSTVNDIINRRTISKRVQFVLQDVVDHRDNQWVPRQRQDTKVKTIDQIHREAEDEEQMTKQLASQYTRGDGRRKRNVAIDSKTKACVQVDTTQLRVPATPTGLGNTSVPLNRSLLQAVEDKMVGANQKRSCEANLEQLSELDKETVVKETRSIIEELCEDKDMKEAVECVKEMKSPGMLHVFVSEAINYALENTSECRQLVGQLFHQLLQDGTLAVDRMVAGLGAVMKTAEDIEIDVPKIWDYIGELLCPPVANRTLPLGTLISTTFPSNLLASGKAALLTTKLLRQCVVVTSEEVVFQLWSSCKEQHDCLQLRPEDLEVVLKKAEQPSQRQAALQLAVVSDGGDGRQGSRQGESNKIISPNPHSEPEIELRKAEQPWQRQAVLLLELTEEQKETQEVFRKFRSILNRLTPQKLTELADATLQLKINTEERLRGVVDLIFTRAITETMYSGEVYANLCQVLAPFDVETVNTKGKLKTITFKRLLLSKCEQEFLKDMQEDEERKTLQKGVETAETEEIRKQRQMELEAAEMASRQRMLGNIRFIGELYKLKTLSESIMHECTRRFQKTSSDEKSLECFAKLMTVTGKELDKEKTKLEIDTYFSKVNDIIKKGKLSKRVQFLLQDVVDLRDNQWVPRQRQDTKVKTIAKQPWRRNAVLQLELTEEQETRKVFRKFQSILNRLTPQKLTKLVDATLQLKINTEERLRGVVDMIFTRVTTETTNCEVYTNLCRVLASLAVETVNAEGKPQAVTFIRLLVTKCQQVFEKDMQEDEERKTMQKGVETAETEEIRKQRQIELEAAEMASRHRSLSNIRFIGELYNLKILFESTIHECMIRLLKSSPNEKSLECFAKLMTVTGTELDKEKTKLEMDTYFSTVNDIINRRTISKRVQFALQDVVDLRDNKWVPRQRQDTEVKTIDQIHREAEDEEQMTKQLASQYTRGDGRRKRGLLHGRKVATPQSPHSVSLEDLTARLGFANVSNNEILKWIERSCTPEECRSPIFIRTLTTAMVQGAVTGKGSNAHLARDLFETRLEILTKYVNSDEKLELEVLLALELAVAKLDHPPKLLCQMFNAVYDCEVVGENSCFTWRDRAQEGVEGKGTAVMSVKAFFDWLESAARESDHPEGTSGKRQA